MGFYRNPMNFLRARHQKMADVLEKNPALSHAVLQLLESILRVGEDTGINPNQLTFTTNMISGRRIMTRLLTVEERAREVKEVKNRRVS